MLINFPHCIQLYQHTVIIIVLISSQIKISEVHWLHWDDTVKVKCYSVCPHMWSSHRTHKDQQVWECRGEVSLCSHVLVSLAPGQLCHLSPLPLSPALLLLPLLQANLLYILLSLRACHPYGISEAGARHPLPLSHSSSRRPSFHAPISAPNSPQSSLKGPGGILSCCPRETRMENKEVRRKEQKKPWKSGYTLFHVLLGTCCASCAHRLGVDLLLLFISMVLPPLDGCCYKVNLLQTLEVSWLWCYWWDPGTSHMPTRSHTHTITHMHMHVVAAECFSQSSLPPHPPAASKELGIPWDLPETHSHVHADTRWI